MVKHMGIVEEIVKNKEQLVLKLMQLMQGNEATTKLNLNNIRLDVGKSQIRLNGTVEVSVTPFRKKK